jgi:hypothetical protein
MHIQKFGQLYGGLKVFGEPALLGSGATLKLIEVEALHYA